MMVIQFLIYTGTHYKNVVFKVNLQNFIFILALTFLGNIFHKGRFTFFCYQYNSYLFINIITVFKPKNLVRVVLYVYILKGQCHEIFDLNFFALIEPIWASDKQAKMLFLKNSFLQRYSN